ncbi:hypothetical protein [Azorhizobium doebereinerae]|uniref:hypothetical protein n=1 Tax=Azorhizobium doebereinerae TaxID=281091 RepID=UPI0004033CF0|nr:hypothetical protein [Azorhizobium doebereinerae]
MAKYDITFSCGHTETRQLVGKETQRHSYIAWAERAGRCSACAKLDKMAAIEAVEVEHDLPALTGSDKQVAWARTIRAEIMGEVMEYLTTLRVKAEAQDKVAEYEERAAVLLQVIGANTAARYWIDNKGRPARELLLSAHKVTAQ